MKTVWLSSLALVVLALALAVPTSAAAPAAQPAVSAPAPAPAAPAALWDAPANAAPQLPDFLAPQQTIPVIACPEIPPGCCAFRCTICCICIQHGAGCGGGL